MANNFILVFYHGSVTLWKFKKLSFDDFLVGKMKLTYNNLNSSQYKAPAVKKVTASIKNPKNNQSLSFRGDVTQAFQKVAIQKGGLSKGIAGFQYTNADKLINNIDNVLGDNFFTKSLQKAGIDVQANEFFVKNTTFFGDLKDTITYPFLKMPLDVANSFLGFLEKTPLSGAARKLSQTKILSSRAQQAQQEKSYALVRDLLNKYAPKAGEFDINKTTDTFQNQITSGITKVAKNYNTRDERTLNRMTTSTVSAIYSAHDFYNISMLQKDDKKEAQKAEKSRFKQEMTRMALSASITFLTLGVLDKYVKKNVWLNATVIALSALISEVGSRLVNGTPLHPLTPDEAANYTKKTLKDRIFKNKEAQKTETKKEENTSKPQENKNVNFKSNMIKDNEAIVFNQFAQKDGTFKSLNRLKSSEVQEKPEVKEENKNEKAPTGKKRSLKKTIGYAFLGASLAYLLSNLMKGKYSAQVLTKKWYNNFSSGINDFISKDEKLNIATMTGFDEIKDKKTKMAYKSGFLKEKLTTRKQTVNLNDLLSRIDTLKESQQGKEIEPILDTYKKHIEALLNSGKSTVDTRSDRVLISGLYSGFTKIFKTVYQIFSAPGALINGVIDNTLFKNSDKAYKKVDSKLNASLGQYKKEVGGLNEIFKKYENNPKKAVEQIKNRTRKFETSSETGELANISRTMVTAISTYFFVNDYTNKVLIESGGKGVKEAHEERNERIAHKLSNFIFNGTLMNLFNSVFKTPLNSSLFNAAVIAGATETTNEFLVRKSICQPIGKKHSKQEIVDYEEAQLQKKGFMGAWSRLFRKITGKKTLSQKAGTNVNKNQNNNQDNTKKVK